MKKSILGIAAAVGLMASGVQSINQATTSNNTATKINASSDNTQTPINNNLQAEQSKQLAIHNPYKPGYEILKDSFPPKYYGMYLQRKGLQKWTKKRKKC